VTSPPLSTQNFATAFGLSPPSSVGGLSCSPLAKGGSQRAVKDGGCASSSSLGPQVSGLLRMRNWSVDSGQLTVVSGTGRQRVPARAVGHRTSAAHAVHILPSRREWLPHPRPLSRGGERGEGDARRATRCPQASSLRSQAS